jgi:nitroreductase/NAD-dependent dihydropyrimidine dehydrogenase PreA subunit
MTDGMPKPLNIIIDPLLCSSCGICGNICVTKKITRNEHYDPVFHEGAGCIGCGQCIAVCPAGAISADSPGYLKPKPAYKSGMDTGILATYLMSRRSVRIWEDKPVPKEVFEELITIASYAPSGVNIHPVGWIIVNDPKKVRAFSDASIAYLASLPDGHPGKPFAGMILEGLAEGEDPICRNAPAVMIAATKDDTPAELVDSIIALSYADIYAPALGLGTCWVGYVMAMLSLNPELGKILGIPEDRKPKYAMLAGYPEYGFRRTPPRQMAEIIWG